jgi:hypothetical protein
VNDITNNVASNVLLTDNLVLVQEVIVHLL